MMVAWITLFKAPREAQPKFAVAWISLFRAPRGGATEMGVGFDDMFWSATGGATEIGDGCDYTFSGVTGWAQPRRRVATITLFRTPRARASETDGGSDYIF